MQHSFSRHLPLNLLVISILLLGSIYLLHDSMRLDPAYMHSWTQSDRLAIAMNFQENGFDFFHPATYNLLTKDGITQVDFPIHDYVIALISNFSGIDLSLTFRLYNLIFFLIGLFFFFRASRLLKIEPLISTTATIFIATLPFLVYYQNGFLPSIPSYAAFCIGLYYLIRSEINGKGFSYEIAVAFLTLSALSRIPFSIFLIALVSTLALRSVQKKELVLRKFISPILGLGMVIAYYFYNQHLASKYGSMFLSSFRTADDGGAFWQSIADSLERWSGQLLSPIHLLIILAMVFLYFKGSRSNAKSEAIGLLKPLGLISAIGVLFYFALMSLQFIDHDYYFIDSFLPLFTLLSLPFLMKLKLSEQWYTTAFAFLFVSSLAMYSYARSNQDYRYQNASIERMHYHYQVYERSANDLAKWGVNEEDTLAVFDISSTNLPFISWRKRGYNSLSSGEESAKDLLAKTFDHAIILDSFKVSDSYFDYPDIAKQLAYVDGNGEISIYQKRQSETIDQFFKRLYANVELNFEDSIPSSELMIKEGAERRILEDLKGYSLKLSDQSEYALTSEYYEEIDHSIKVSVQFEIFPSDSLKGLQLVISSEDYRYTYYLENEVEYYHDWQKLQFHRKVSAQAMKNKVPLKVYFWNPEGSIAYIDNYEILIYE